MRTMFDYESSVERLIVRVALMREAERDTEWRKREAEFYRGLAENICEAAESLTDDGNQDRLKHLEFVFNQPLPGRVGLDGFYEGERYTPRAVQYQGLVSALRELSDTAKSMADDVPSTRQRTAGPFAAMAYLHIRNQSERRRPVLSNDSEEVLELLEILKKSNVFLSPVTVRGLLTDALKTFDPLLFPDDVSGLLVFRQG